MLIAPVQNKFARHGYLFRRCKFQVLRDVIYSNSRLKWNRNQAHFTQRLISTFRLLISLFMSRGVHHF